MRNLVTATSAAITAILIGLLIANVASSARAAEIEHAKAQQLAAVEAAYSDDDIRAQLAAYQTRYEQAYKQLAAAYQALATREAQYRALWQQSSGSSAQLAAANTDLDTKLAQAYAELDAAQAALNDLAARSGLGGGITSATARPAATASPRPASSSPRATITPKPSRDD
jgi:multidrug resistance efflux pump